MILSIGANLYGFAAGSSLFFLQLIAIGLFQFSNVKPQVSAAEITMFVMVGSMWMIFILAILYWLSTIVIVFPFLFLVTAFRIPAWVTGVIGASVAGSFCWFFLSRLGVADNMDWSLSISCLSSSVMTGAVTGAMLALLSKKKANKTAHRTAGNAPV
jgi:hypothetical protein